MEKVSDSTADTLRCRSFARQCFLILRIPRSSFWYQFTCGFCFRALHVRSFDAVFFFCGPTGPVIKIFRAIDLSPRMMPVEVDARGHGSMYSMVLPRLKAK